MSWAAAAFAAVSALSSLKQSRDESALADFNATISENNAAMQRSWGLAEADRIRKLGIRQRGELHAQAGASGVDAGTGSILDVLSDDAIENELDALDAQFRGESGARAREGEAQAFRFRASTVRSGAVFSALGAGMKGYSFGQGIST